MGIFSGVEGAGQFCHFMFVPVVVNFPSKGVHLQGKQGVVRMGAGIGVTFSSRRSYNMDNSKTRAGFFVFVLFSSILSYFPSPFL